MEKPVEEKSPVARMIDDLHEKFIRSQGTNGTFPKLEAGIRANKAPAASNPNEKKGMKEEAGNYSDGGDVQPQPFGVGGQSGDGRSNLDALMSLIKSGGTAPAIPGMQGSLTQNLATSIGQGVTAPGTAGVINRGLGTNLQDSGGPQPMDMSNIPAPEQPMAMPPTGGAPQGQPSATPQLSDMDSALNKAPDTNYDFYKNVGSDQRAALYKQLLDQQRSPGNLIAQGIGGIGDAFSALGGKSTDFQDKAAGIASKNTENRIGAVDTQRQQKMQDLTGNEEAAMLDPKGPRSVAMREMLKSQNINVPSGMNAKTMLSTLGPIAEIAMAKAKLAEEAGYHRGELENKGTQVRTGANEALVKEEGILSGIKNAFSPERKKAMANLRGIASGGGNATPSGPTQKSNNGVTYRVK